MTTQTTSLAQQFAAEYAKGAVPAMLKAIKNTKRLTLAILAGAMLVSYSHQATELFHIHGVSYFGLVVPAIIDAAILTMVQILQTVGMRTAAKVAAGIVGTLCGMASVAINIGIIPPAVGARAIFGGIVLIAIGVKVVASLVGPDFTRIEAREAQIAPTTPTSSATARRCEPGCTCGKHTRKTAAKPTRTRKAPAARKPRTPRAPKLDAEFAALAAGSYPAAAPVSPSPYL